MIFTVSIYRADGDWLIGQTSREAGVTWRGARAGDEVLGGFVPKGLCLAAEDYKIAFDAYSPDHAICYALTELIAEFSVRLHFHTWGTFVDPCLWETHHGN